MRKNLLILAVILFVITTATAFMILLVPVNRQSAADLADELLDLRARALGELELRHYEEAERCLMRLRAELPRDLAVNRLLVRYFYETGQRGTAEKLVRKLLRKYPQDPLLINDLGCLLLARGEAEEAEEFLRHALREKEDSAGILLNLAEALDACGSSEEAEKYRKAAALLLVGKLSSDRGDFILYERRQQAEPHRIFPQLPAVNSLPSENKEPAL